MNKTVIFRWNQALRDQLNLRLPLSDWTCSVHATNDKILFRFTKLDPLKPWGPIHDMFKVEYFDPKSIVYEGGGVYGGFPPENVQPIIENNDVVASQPAGPELDENGQKECGACTMRNDAAANQCYICETFF